MKANFGLRALTTAAVAAACSAAAMAQYSSGGFESLTPGVITGQDAYYVPAAGGVDGAVRTYVDLAAAGWAVNPEGDCQAAFTARADLNCCRAQRDNGWATSGVWRLGFDFNVRFTGDINTIPAPRTINNTGSFSLQPYPGAGCVLLLAWDDPNDPNAATSDDLTYSLWTIAFAADDTQPGAGFTLSPFFGLSANRWYQATFLIDITANKIGSVTMRDIAANSSLGTWDAANDPGGVTYLDGGATRVADLTGFRMFGGGQTCATGQNLGNSIAWDNVCINDSTAAACARGTTCSGGPTGCPGPNGTRCDASDVDGDCDVDLTDLARLLSNFGTQSGATRGMGDLDGDHDVDLTDLAILLSNFGTTCV